MIRKVYVLVATLLAFAAVPAIAGANPVTSFSATGTIVRIHQGTATIDVGTGGLLTTGQVFQGNLNSDWKGLDGAVISVNQNSLIGIATFTSDGVTVSADLFGQAWGTFDISQRFGSVSGAYTAELQGTLYLDPLGLAFGCPATTALGPIDVTGDGEPDPVGAFVSVEDTGEWQVTPGSATGQLKRIDEVGGILLAMAEGCLEGNETANLTLNGQLVPPGKNVKDHEQDDEDETEEHQDDDRHGLGEREDDGDDEGDGSWVSRGRGDRGRSDDNADNRGA